MNRAQLRAATFDRVGVDSDDERLTATVMDRLINDALHLIEVEHDWPWLQASTNISATAGTGSYATPGDWLRTRYLRIDDEAGFERREIGELDDLWPDASGRGKPYEYAIESDLILIRPIPDTSYTIVHRYVKRESDLTDDAQSPLMPASFHTAIVECAAYLALRRTRELDRAGAAKAEYQEWRQRMLDDRRRSAGPNRVKIRADTML